LNIQPFRSAFTVFIADSELLRAKEIAGQLDNSGYTVQHFLNREGLEQELLQNPPHILILHDNDPHFITKNHTVEFVEKLLARLPELQIIILASADRLEPSTQLYAEGVYDVLVYPLVNGRQLLRAIDRAAETDYYMYLNEQLKDKISQRPDQFSDSSFALFEIWFNELFRKADTIAGIDHFMREISRHLNGSEVIFFKYIASRSTLVAETSVGLEMRLLQNVGIDLKTTERDFTEAALLKPHLLNGLGDLVKKGFQRTHFSALPILSGREIRGVMVILPKNESPFLARDPYIRLCLEALQQFERLHALKKKMHKTTMLDEQTEVFSREFVLKKIREEISRARRISKPVSVLLIAIDHFQEFQLEREAGDVDRLLKALASIFVRNSRLNDLVGRIEMDQFVLILPHTDKKGAAIKGERLRRMIEGADFSKVLSRPANITVSVGVSEYPSICHDADGFLQTAEEALYQVKRDGNNRVCLATPTGRFTPDFEVK
jgi:diguanylate cyclase (GGDEF)-like protein